MIRRAHPSDRKAPWSEEEPQLAVSGRPSNGRREERVDVGGERQIYGEITGVENGVVTEWPTKEPSDVKYGGRTQMVR